MTFNGATLTYTKMVSAVMCAIERITCDNILFWLETDRFPLFLKVRAPPYTHSGVSWFLNTNQKLSNIILQGHGDSGCELEIKSSTSRHCTWRKAKSKRSKVCKNFSKIMEATSSTAFDQGLTKRFHVCWGPALSFLYCTFFFSSYISEILLKAPVNIILNKFY